MIRSLEQIFERVLDRFSAQVATYLPQLLVTLAVLTFAWLSATSVRWLLARALTGAGLDRYRGGSGLFPVLDHLGRVRGARLAAGAAYWAILLVGFLAALNAFDSGLTAWIAAGAVSLFPKLLTAAAILLAGAWLAQYLGRSALVWASNEEVPSPRRLAAVVRAAIGSVAVVVAADAVDFAKNVFLAAFIILGGGCALAAGLALGLGGREAVRRYLRDRTARHAEQERRSLWRHL